jgi:hypothetical protein
VKEGIYRRVIVPIVERSDCLSFRGGCFGRVF